MLHNSEFSGSNREEDIILQKGAQPTEASLLTQEQIATESPELNENPSKRRKELQTKIFAIKGLPSERDKYRYDSLSEDYDFVGNEALNFLAAEELVDLLDPGKEVSKPIARNEKLSEGELGQLIQKIGDENSSEKGYAITKLSQWVQAGEQGEQKSERYARWKSVQEEAAAFIAQNKQINLGLLALLGEIDQFRNWRLSEEVLVQSLAGVEGVQSRLRDQIEVLNRLDDSGSRVLMHKILDFTTESAATHENYSPQEKIEKDLFNTRFYRELSWVGVKENGKKNNKNYLLEKHWQDFDEVYQGSYGARKTGSVVGIAGGSSDAIIYNFRRILEAYHDRLGLGINKGYVIKNPVLPLSEGGLYGYYEADKLSSVYVGSLDENRANSIQSALVTKNNPSDEYIYNELNAPIIPDPKRDPEGQKLVDKFDVIWAFKDSLKLHNRKFFYDLSKIDVSNLHPFVLGELLSHNQRYISEVAAPEDEPNALPDQEFLNLLSPVSPLTAEEEYVYRYMMSLQMRKKIGDDFGIVMENIPLFGQVQFLNFLNKSDVKNAERLQKILRKSPNKEDVAISFLSCAEDRDNAEAIMQLAEHLPEDLSSAIFAKYSEMVRQSENIKTEMVNEFGGAEVTSEVAGKVKGDLFSKANSLLKRMSDGAIVRPEMVAEQLDAYRGEVALYSSLAKELMREGNVSLQEIIAQQVEVKDSTDLTDQEKREMVAIFAAGRDKSYPEVLRRKSKEKYLNKLNTPGNTFNLLKHNGHPMVSFYSYTQEDGSLYVGGFNLSPEAKGPFAASFAKTWLEDQVHTKDVRADVLESNAVARLLYTRTLGFRQDSENPNFTVIDDKGESHTYLNLVRIKKIESAKDA
jgi:hypothetical protein